MIHESPRTYGHSGDLGWNDTEEASIGGLGSAFLLIATSAYFGAIWLLSGLPPLPFVASRVRCLREVDARSELAHQGKWRSEKV
jgi:hypothetical protein